MLRPSTSNADHGASAPDGGGAASEATAGVGAKKFGSWLKSGVGALGEHVKEMRDNTKLIAADVADSVQKDLDKARKAGQKLQTTLQSGLGTLRRGEERVQVTFAEGSLGLELDFKNGGVVFNVVPGSQADQLGVRAKDRLIAIGAEPLPPPEEHDKLKEAVKVRMKLPRPIEFTFARAKENSDKAEKNNEGVAAQDAPSGPSVQDQLRQAEAAAQQARRDLEDAQREAQDSREEVLALRADLELSKAWATQEVRKAHEEMAKNAACDQKSSGDSNAMAAQAELSAMRAQLMQLEATAAQERRASEAAQRDALNRAEAAEAALHQGQKDLEQLRKTVGIATEEVASLKSALESKEAMLQEKMQDIAAVQSELSSLRSSIEERETSAQQKAGVAETEAANLRKNVEELQQSAEQMRAEAEADANTAREKISTLQAALAEQEAMVAEKSREAASIAISHTEQVEELTATIERLQSAQLEDAKRAEFAEAQMGQLREDADKLRAACAAAAAVEANKDGELSSSAAAAAAALSAAEGEAAALREEVVKLRTSAEEAKARSEAEAVASREELSSLRSSLSAQEMLVADTTREVNSVKAQLTSANAELERLQAASVEDAQRDAKASEALAQLRAENERLRAELMASEAMAGDLKQELGGQQEARSEESQRLQDAEAELSRLQAEVAALKNARAEDAQRIEADGEKAASLRAAREETAKQLETAESSLSQMHDEADRLRTACATAIAEQGRLEQLLSASATAEGESAVLKEELRKLQVQVEVMRSKAELDTTSSHEELRAVTVSLSEKTSRVDILTEELNAATQRAVSAEASHSKLFEDIEHLRTACAAEAQRADAAQALIDELREESEGLRAARAQYVERMETAEAMLAKLREESDQHAAEAERAAADASLATSQTQEELGNLRKRSSQQEALIGELRTALASDMRRADAAEATHAEKGRRVEQLERLVGELRAGAEQLDADCKEERQRRLDAEAILEELREEIARLRKDSQDQDESEDVNKPLLIGKAETIDTCAALLGDDSTPNGSQSSKHARDVQELRSKLAFSESENQTLRKKLDARPIVYQFGPDPEDDASNVEDADEPDGDSEAGIMATTDDNSSAAAPQEASAVATKTCRRRCARGLYLCRRQRAAKNLERGMRAFTKMLLQYPFLMWLFYVQLLVVWSVEIWRQAISRPLAQDPVSRIEGTVQALSGGGR